MVWCTLLKTTKRGLKKIKTGSNSFSLEYKKYLLASISFYIKKNHCFFMFWEVFFLHRFALNYLIVFQFGWCAMLGYTPMPTWQLKLKHLKLHKTGVTNRVLRWSLKRMSENLYVALSEEHAASDVFLEGWRLLCNFVDVRALCFSYRS